MNFKILIFLSCLAYSKTDIIPLTMEYINSDMAKFGESTNQYVNLIMVMDLIDGYKTYPVKVTLDSRSENIWVTSTKCKSSNCPAISTPSLPSGTGKKMSIDDDQISGTSTTYKVKMGDQEIDSMNVLSADTVSRGIGNKLSKKSTNGVLGLNALNSNLGAQGILSLCTAEKCRGLYIGIPEGITKQTNLNLAPHGSVEFVCSSEMNIRINNIRNSMGEWKTWCFEGCTATIDTTLNAISGPADDINSINKFIGTDSNGNIACYKTKYLDPLVFYMGFNKYELKADNYIIKSDDKFNPQCKSAFVVDEEQSDEWTLGIPFLNQYLNVFDFNSRAVTFMKFKD